MTQTVKINGKDYSLKVTLGLYKHLSFPRNELESIYTDTKRLIEVLEAAIYYGNKHKEGWKSIADMKQVIIDEHFDEIEDPNLIVKVDGAIYDNLPDRTKEAIKKLEENKEHTEESKKK